MKGDVNWAAALGVARHDAHLREAAMTELAEEKLLAAMTGVSPTRLGAILAERNRRMDVFEHLSRTTADRLIGSPARRAAESVYDDVITGRL